MTLRSTLFKLRCPAIAALFTVVGCGGSPPPEPQNAPTEASAEPAEEPKEEAPAEQPASPPPAPKKSENANDIPDEYTLTEADCAQLGKQFAAVTRADQVGALDPKLSASQRAQTEKRIDEVATKMGDNWVQSCQASLVGKVAERKRLACALEARSVKAFDTCINGEAPPP
ncbi:hypothetical protein [Polyangium aurulentum]|uniref:hypothetical protein n=1 Tax=Polyangium aurulentum TaxID=2567896 RepID=UPI0010ADBF38|nr:hypothetical protein [Polyangium aurulentum]UQA60034.1 hypothetical protein E8A73_005970 [Polyangium aurulentum]